MASKGLKSGDMVLETNDHRVHFEAPSAIVVHRQFAGFLWRFTVEIDQLGDIATGALREIPMTRLQAVETASAEMSEGAISRLLGSLGFDAPSDEASEGPAAVSPERGPQLTGLEDGLEEEADFGSVSEMDLDDFLAAYEAATKPKKQTKKTSAQSTDVGIIEPPSNAPPVPDIATPKAEDVEPAKEEQTLESSLSGPGGADLLSRLFGDLGNLDDPETEDTETGEPGASAEDVSSARGFLELLVNNEKMEVLPGADMDALAAGLSPILAMEERHRVKAEAVLDWLLDQEDVEDVYASDDELVALVRAW